MEAAGREPLVREAAPAPALPLARPPQPAAQQQQGPEGGTGPGLT